jgi:hypothetical protein
LLRHLRVVVGETNRNAPERFGGKRRQNRRGILIPIWMPWPLL